jgi:hypothetical protein
MVLPPGTPSRRTVVTVAIALVAGVAHAAGVAALVARLDYPVDALANAPAGRIGAVVGLVAVVAVPIAVALSIRVVSPLVVVAASVVWPIYLTAATPLPTFSRLGDYTVVEGPRFVDAYVDAWYVWLFVALLVGLAEAVVRLDVAQLPAPARVARLRRWLGPGEPAARRTAAVCGGVHATVFLVLAADWAYFVPGGYLPSPWYVGLAVLVWTVVGLAVVGGVGPYLLVRQRIVAPTLAFAWLARQVGWAQNMPLPDDPLPIYFVGWPVFAGAFLLLGGAEYVLRRLGRWGRAALTAG